MNGTTIFNADNETFIEPGGQMNHTRNATLDFATAMKVFLLIEPDPSMNEVSAFRVEVGMRNFNRTRATDDDDDDDENVRIIEVILTEKNVTLNERLMIMTIVLGVILYNCKARYCGSSWDTHKREYDRKKVFSTDVEDAEIYMKGDSEEEEVQKLTPALTDIQRLSGLSSPTHGRSSRRMRFSETNERILMDDEKLSPQKFEIAHEVSRQTP